VAVTPDTITFADFTEKGSFFGIEGGTLSNRIFKFFYLPHLVFTLLQMQELMSKIIINTWASRYFSKVKLRYKYFILSFLLLCYIQLVEAQNEGKSITVSSFEEVSKQVTDQNYDLKSYQLSIEKNKQDWKVAKAYRLPSISGSFNGQRNLALATTPLPGEIFGQPGTTINAEFGQEYNFNAGISLNKSIFDRQAGLQAKLAKLNVESAEVQKQALKEVLLQQASHYFYAAVVAQKAVEIWEEDLKIADSVVLLTKQRYEEGLFDLPTYNKAQINALSLKQNLNNSHQLYENNLSELKKIMGLNYKDSLILENDLNENLPLSISTDLLMDNQEIVLAEVIERQSQLQVKVQRAALLPKLSLNTYLGQQQFRNDFGLSFGENAWTDYSYTGITLSIPIFSGFTNRNRLKGSKIEFQKAQNDLENAQIQSEIADIQLIQDYSISLDNSKVARESLALYEQNKVLAYQQYTEGLIGLDKYLNTFEECLKAENTFLNTLLTTYSYYSQLIPRIQ